MKTKEQEIVIMSELRDKVVDVVKIRLQLQNVSNWLAADQERFELIAESLEVAIDALYEAETAIGESHQHLLVAHAMSGIDGKSSL